ncbi:LysE family translocator [Flavobacterium sp.]|jgi:threonine/homoserine/homoserine lactone efflux protein|uniref:LysE family translocator n=1 Tax=Flavobacterium sp. TaxID=239 RepID=UPI002A8319C0|nr:LysE family transporter [Flavobacterium sp.]
MLHDILTAIPLGILLAFTIGPVFFVLLETSITKGFRAAIIFDVGVIFADLIFILIAYFSTNQLLEKLKDDPSLFFIGGVIMLSYGIISFIKQKKTYKGQVEEDVKEDVNQPNNYLNLFFKGFLLNFINIGVLAFWMMMIISFGPKLNMDSDRIIVFIATILLVYLIIDSIKIVIAKQLKTKLTPYIIYKVKSVISVILIIFGVFLMIQCFFPDEKKMIEKKFELLNK